MRTGCLVIVCFFASAAGVLAGTITLNTPIDVLCHGIKCGEMKFTQYDLGFDVNPLRGGVILEGKFTQTKAATYHYLQSMNTATLLDNWIDNSALSVPLVDPPPGGYKQSPSDLKPYYDRTGGNPPFPTYFDQPQVTAAFLKANGNKQKATFETWLVCVISEEYGNQANAARDDTFRVALLLGWTWGYTIEWKENGDGKEDENDFDPWSKDPLQTIDAPSQNFRDALNQVYGPAGPTQDRFNVVLGDCKDCFPPGEIPEPSTFVLSGLGAAWFLRRAASASPPTRRVRAARKRLGWRHDGIGGSQLKQHRLQTRRDEANRRL